MMRCVKTEKRAEGREEGYICEYSSGCIMKPYGDTNLWSLKYFLQALLFISYICKVPENILVTFNHNYLLLLALHIVIPWVGFLSLLYFQLL